MVDNIFLPTAGVAAIAIALLGYLCYQALLPRPIPGIPYNKKSAHHILGDAPDLFKFKDENGHLFGYIAKLAVEMGEPVFQIFMRPMGQPWVIVMDPREGNDIMTRRIKEFDRSAFFGQVFQSMLPKNHVHMPTGDEWHAHRRLVSDTMAPHFLKQVAGPQMWYTMRSMVDLWREKARLAEGRPISATTDVHNTTLDIIWAATFGGEIGPNRTRTKRLAATKSLNLASNMDKAVDFPETQDPPAFKSILTLVESMTIPLNSMFPVQAHWFALNTHRNLVEARKEKDNLIRSRLRSAQEKFSQKSKEDIESMAGLQSALDLVVSKEIKIAEKEGRPVDLDSQAIQDELFGFLIAGADTTSTTSCWGIKFLTLNQGAQTKLRNALRSSFPRAAKANETPTIEEITNTTVHYLDAVVEECPRVGLIAPGTVRKALRDTEVLGYHVPAGTDVWLMNNGPGFVMDPIPVNEHERSKTSQASKYKTPAWSDDLAEFKPERWLDKDGNFSPSAGPSNAFGAGPRGCFGKSPLKPCSS